MNIGLMRFFWIGLNQKFKLISLIFSELRKCLKLSDAIGCIGDNNVYFCNPVKRTGKQKRDTETELSRKRSHF